MEENIHKGHRDRVKKEFLSGAFGDSTPDHKWLELLLFYCLPQGDTNPLAHELINKYKTLNGVFEAPVDELAEFKGITPNNAVLLKMIIPLARKCEINYSNDIIRSVTPESIGDFLLKQYYGLTTEKLGILCLDSVGKVLGFQFIGEGNISEIAISYRAVISYILKLNATNVILCHNHPKSFALPSVTDVETTVKLARMLGEIGISLKDHIIISGNDYISLAQSRDYKDIFEQ